MKQQKASKPVLKSAMLKNAPKIVQGIVPKTNVASASKGKRI